MLLRLVKRIGSRKSFGLSRGPWLGGGSDRRTPSHDLTDLSHEQLCRSTGSVDIYFAKNNFPGNLE